MVTADLVRSLLDYDPRTGVFVWRENRGSNQTKGKAAGGLHGPYLMIPVAKRLYLAHRLAWLYVHDSWPENEIDHINGVKTDNRIENLRDATRLTNAHNIAKARSDAVSGVRGVRWSSRYNSWHALLQHEGRRMHLGSFKSMEEAMAAYEAKKRSLGLPFRSDPMPEAS